MERVLVGGEAGGVAVGVGVVGDREIGGKRGEGERVERGGIGEVAAADSVWAMDDKCEDEYDDDSSESTAVKLLVVLDIDSVRSRRLLLLLEMSLLA